MSQKKTAATIADQLRVRPGSTVTVDDFDPRATPGYPGAGKRDAPELVQGMADELSDLQERLYANGRDNPEAQRVLLILQGLDTSGKGGVIRHSVGMVDPQGIQLHAFKAPTEEERKHDYLWRIRRELPTAGMIGIFDRSQYEDVLIARVDDLVPESVWSKRFDEINAFEAEVAAQGTTIIKCFLNVSHDKQKERLLERLDNPEKYWKYNPGDVDTRSKWSAYMAAYADVLTRCSTEVAPWYVIPADRKWYRNWAVTTLLLEHLRQLDPQWPPADFDVAEQRRRVEES
ncbi:PPK2 family polyphosphate:nucleotide phosphotransferase [Propionibacteriaceae bacterium ES.041]|uniref:polyphosphate kinase 2 family protein n=1 Tax=Enemella evansiae TaxID=2016499 RepID=UPI000B95FCFC|nr:polyphosphate kinase 2 family protein [Enemella evansiae]OYO02328.1 phosphate--nucleotide phosphotransferase [Enemella evansiae]PFG67046.1 PPK2 family polyphosphate:nucleotide phosphotransferase [Propionibacteriaceae bacterium ES.041]